MDSTSVTLYLFVLLLGTLVRADLDSDYTNSAYLDESKTYKLYWKINNEKKSIQFAARVKTLGWVGFGISSGNGNMVGSDVVIAWVSDNKGYLKDRYADAKTLPPIDEKQDYTLIAARESNGETIVEFSRLWDTCDDKDNKIEAGTSRLIYAYHTNDPPSNVSIPQHTIRGSRSLILLNVNKNKPRLPIDAKYFDLRQNDTVIPPRDTSYLCKAFEIPQFSEKKHVVQIEPVVTYGNEGTVHHMLVYQCGEDFPRSNLSVVSHCYESNMPPAIQACAGGPIVAGWAIGGGAMFFPNHTGLAIGTSDAPRYVVLEIHYDNPKKIPGIHDNSGLRFHYTPTLRQYDAGILWIGDAVSYYTVIPPKQDKWLISSYCNRECTKNIDSSLPGKGINIFGSFLHAHLQGISLWTRHVRNGKELPEIVRDNHYDFNYQEFHFFYKEVRVLPGDDIIHECLYQSKDKTKPVYGGLSTKEEMCLNFMYYYPKVDLNRCESLNFGYGKLLDKRYGGRPPVQWTEEVVHDVKQSYLNETQVLTICKNQKNQKFEAHGKMVSKPVINDPLRQPDICKLPPTTGSSSPTLIPSTTEVTKMLLLLMIAYSFIMA